MTSRIFLVVMLTLIVSLLAGCNGGDSGSDVTPNGAAGVFTPSQITLKEFGSGDLWELVDDALTFTDDADREWTAPKGALTDGASVPRFALSVTDGRFTKEFLKAAVLHDAYASDDNENLDQYHQMPWRDVHRMFYDACIAGGTSTSKAQIMFAAVWLAGDRWDDPERSLDEVPTALLQTEFEMCKAWIEQEDPTIEEVEAMLDDHVGELLTDEP